MNSLFKILALIGVVAPLISVYSIEGEMYWPEPNKPNTEPDPFIQTQENNIDNMRMEGDRLPSMLHDSESLYNNKDSLKELPLEDDPLLRTPLDEKSLQNDPLNNVNLYDDDDDL